MRRRCSCTDPSCLGVDFRTLRRLAVLCGASFLAASCWLDPHAREVVLREGSVQIDSNTLELKPTQHLPLSRDGSSGVCFVVGYVEKTRDEAKIDKVVSDAIGSAHPRDIPIQVRLFDAAGHEYDLSRKSGGRARLTADGNQDVALCRLLPKNGEPNSEIVRLLVTSARPVTVHTIFWVSFTNF